MSEQDEVAESYIARLTAVADQVPVSMMEDIMKRLGDWSLSGGNMSDDYVLGLVKNAERMVKIMEVKEDED